MWAVWLNHSHEIFVFKLDSQVEMNLVLPQGL